MSRSSHIQFLSKIFVRDWGFETKKKGKKKKLRQSQLEQSKSIDTHLWILVHWQ